MNDPEVSQEYSNHIVGEVNQNQTIGQSFIARRARLNSATLWATSLPQQDLSQATGQLIIKLFRGYGETLPIYATSLPIASTWQNSQVDISFTPLTDPPGQYYYLQIESSGGSVQLLGRNEDAYPDGSAYKDGVKINADLAFRTAYDYGLTSVLQDLSTFGSHAIILFPLGLTLFLPGFILLDISGLRHRYDPSSQAALALGLSLAVISLVMLWSTVIHYKWTRTSVFFIFGILLGFAILRSIVNYQKHKSICNQTQESSFADTQLKRNLQVYSTLALIGIVAGSFFVRLSMIRDLATPAWVDSVHHAMITRLIIQDGGIPSSYQPYMEFNVYNYHVGFHSGLAVFTWLSGLEIPDAMLVYGQAINALAALSVYLLTVTFTRKPVAGLFAAFITSFFTPMPAYYTSWGRYSQLAGLLILPAIISLLWPVLHQENTKVQAQRDIRYSIFLAGIALSGLFLVHYRVTAFALLLLIAEIIISTFPQHGYSTVKISSKLFTRSLTFLLGFIILVSPWLIPAISQIFLPKLTPPETTQAVIFGDFTWRFLTTAYGKQALVLASLGIVWAILKKPRLALSLLLWILQLLFVANLDALKLPGGGFITGTSVVITLFIPISLFGGYFLDGMISSWKSVLPLQHTSVRYTSYVVLSIAAMLLAILGACQILPIINPITILSRHADRSALEWINEYLPAESTFLINSFPWGFGLYAGSDGGYWISPVTGAKSMPPPALYGLGEIDIVNEINSINHLVVDTETTPQELLDLMLDRKIDYIFLGRRGGPLSHASLLQSGLFDQIYDVDGVWILKIRELH